jgi:NADH pyrophosphatase NudC (nudix superfamily)
MDPIVYVRQYLTMQEFLILAALLGLIPAAIAKSKGRPFLLWWIFGFLALIIALPCALMMKRDVRNLEHRQMREGFKKCPHCAEMIKGDAKVCRFCQRELAPKITIAAGNRRFCSSSGVTFRLRQRTTGTSAN